MAAFLTADAPGYDDASPLVAEWEFTTDEAYLMHCVFEQLFQARTLIVEATSTARSLVGIG
jgi:hypothetical protein